MSRSALTALASSTIPKPSLYFSVPASCSTSPRSLRVVSSRYAVDLWMSSSLETSVTPDHPRRAKNSITVTALSTDCTKELLRTNAHMFLHPTPRVISGFTPRAAMIDQPHRWLLPGRSNVLRTRKGAGAPVELLRLSVAHQPVAVLAGPPLASQPVESEEVYVVAGKPLLGQVGHDL